MSTKISIIIPSAPQRSTSGILNNLMSIKPAGCAFEIFIIKGTWPPLQRNLGIQKAGGKYIFFFDDDVVIPKGSMEKALETFKKNPRVQVVGGPNLTPKNSSFMRQCFGQMHGSFFAGFRTITRYRVSKNLKKVDENNLTTCNLAFRADILKENLFQTDFYANEENELLGRILRKGNILGYNRGFFVYHQRRKNIWQYMKQIFRWGEGRTQHFLKKPAHFKPVFFVPLLFLFYLCGIPWLYSLPYFMPLLLYILLAIVFTIHIVWTEKSVAYLIVLPWLFFLTHMTYAIGTLSGFVTVFIKKKLPDKKDFHVIKIDID